MITTLAHQISLAAAVESARQLDDTLGQLVVSKGVALADLRGRLEGTLKAILVGEPEIAAEAKALGNVTGDFRGALDAMRGLGEEGAAARESALIGAGQKLIHFDCGNRSTSPSSSGFLKAAFVVASRGLAGAVGAGCRAATGSPNRRRVDHTMGGADAALGPLSSVGASSSGTAH